MIQHHPDDGLLLAQAAGTLSTGHSLLVASHVDACAECQARLRELESVGGAMLEQLAPAVLPSQSLAEAMAAIDAPPPAPKATAPVRRNSRPALPPGMAWPRALRGCGAALHKGYIGRASLSRRRGRAHESSAEPSSASPATLFA